MAVSVSGQQVERQVNLDPGWNTVGIDVQDVRFSEDIQPKCQFGWYNRELTDKDPEDIDQGERYYVWSQTGGEWSHPDYMNPAKGYSLFLDQDTSCSFTVQGEKADVGTLTVRTGWNIVNARSNSDIRSIWNQCGGNNGLAWWSMLKEQGMEDDDIWDSDRYHFWINRGDDWRHPFQNSYNVQTSDGVYVYGREGCTVELDTEEEDDSNDEQPLVENYLILEDASTSVTDISKNQDLEISLDISLNNDPEDIGARPTLALLKNGQRIEERTIDWDTDSVTFTWDKIWTGEEEFNEDFDLVMDRNNEGDYRWQRQSESLGSLDIERCGQDYVYNEYHNSHETDYDGCILKNEELSSAVSDIEASTGWDLQTETSVVHTLESIGGEETAEGETLSIDTGEQGFCGRVYFENEYVGEEGEFTVNTKMNTLGDSDRLGWRQYPQNFFIEVDGEKVTEADIGHGKSQEFTHEVEEGSNVRIGIVDEPDPPLFGCGGWARRTSVEMDVVGDFDMPDYDRENPFRER